MPCSCQVPVPQYPETAHWGPILWKILHGLAERAERSFDRMDEIREWHRESHLFGLRFSLTLALNGTEDVAKEHFENIEKKGVNCIQTFNKRRVLYYNEEQTEKIINGEIQINEIDDSDLKVGDCCAPGGSILIKNSLFFEVGGYDPELFYGWSPEDLFFWDKIESMESIGITDNPKNEIYHMYHKPQNLNKEQMVNSEEKLNLYESIKKEYLTEIIKIKKEIIGNYI